MYGGNRGSRRKALKQAKEEGNSSPSSPKKESSKTNGDCNNLMLRLIVSFSEET